MAVLASSRRPCRRNATVGVAALVILTTIIALGSRGVANAESSTIPRSTNRRVALSDNDSSQCPPWNPSHQIDDDGFLKSNFFRQSGEWEEEADIGGKHGPKSRRFKQLPQIPVRIRQVPGDGNCLFHSISTCLNYVMNGTQVSMKNTTALRETSTRLRQKAVDCLERNPRRLLFLQGNEYLRARDLVDAAAAQYELTGERYCELMRQESYWGGGPEIVALCNVLRRPIHVYELTSSESDKQFHLRRMACFGSPRFDRREPIHILSADSRFPDLSPGKQHASGNHFLAMFPTVPNQSGSRQRVPRGGVSLTLRRQMEEHKSKSTTVTNKADAKDGLGMWMFSYWWGQLSRLFLGLQ